MRISQFPMRASETIFSAPYPRNSGMDFAVYFSPGILVTGADTGTARDMAHFEPGGVAF
jgi:hypothetical protein